MAIAQSNGSATTATSTVNNGGVAVHAGSVQDNLSNLGLGLPPTPAGGVVATDDVTKAIPAGPLAFNHNDPVAPRYTETLASVSNTALYSASTKTEERAKVHRILVRNGSFALVSGVRTTAFATSFRAGNFNLYTGKYTPRPTTTADTFNDDTSVVGSLTYKGKSSNPTTVSYGDLS